MNKVNRPFDEQITARITDVHKDKKDDINLPANFFAKYKDEIEEMKKSRTNLVAQESNGQAGLSVGRVNILF